MNRRSTPKLQIVVFDLWGTLGDKPFEIAASLAEYFGVTCDAAFRRQYEEAIQRQPWPSPEALAVGFLRAFGFVERSGDVRFIADLIARAEMDAAPFEGIQAVLDRLYGRVRLALLSNTTSFESRAVARWGFDRYFEVLMFSWQTGALKPDDAAFESLHAALGLPPVGAVLLVDDLEPNVAAARRIGYLAHRYENVAGLTACLGRLIPSI